MSLTPAWQNTAGGTERLEMSEISEERTLIAILQTRVMALDADKSALEAENAKLKEVLKPFADIADIIEVETEGVGDDDKTTLHLYGYEMARWTVDVFKKARAALT